MNPLSRRAALLTGSAALVAGCARGSFTGTVRTIGPGQAYATTYTTPGAKPAVVSALKDTATATSTMTVSNAVVGSAQAIVTIGSSVFTFNETDATDIGSISDPLAPVLGISSRFTMSCLLRTLPGCPLRVYFRRIAAPNAWCSVVFEYGNALTGQADGFAPYGPYNVTVTDGSGGTHTYSAVTHYYFSRWRHVFNTWPFAVTPTSTLISLGLVPHFNISVAAGKYNDPGVVTYSGPMSLANIPSYMSQGGEGDVIGLFDGWTGGYLCGVNTTQRLADMLAGLEGSASEPWHFRDATTGAPIDTVTYPNASMGGGPGVASPWLGYGDGMIYPGVEVDTSHMPDKAYVPFLLHGDPYALEEMQFVANFTILNMNPGNRGTNSDWNLSNGALRGVAWCARNRARTTRCTPTSVPGWLKPKAYWQTMMDNHLAFLTNNFVNNAAAPYSGLHGMDDDPTNSPAEGVIPIGTGVSPWQENYFSSSMGHIVEMGFSTWLPVFTWHIAYLVALNNGTSGWNRSTPILYHAALRASSSSPYVNTFTDFYNLNVALGVDGISTGSQAHRVSVGSYDVACQAALAIAARMGLPGAEACRAWLLPEIQTLARSIALGWSIA